MQFAKIDPDNLPKKPVAVCNVNCGGKIRLVAAFVGDDGKLYRTSDYSVFLGLTRGALFHRFREYGHTREGILDKKLPWVRTYSDKLPAAHKWDRRKCRREGLNCQNYGECQAQRLKMPGHKAWVAPEDTDQCYIAPPFISGIRAHNPTEVMV